MMMGRRKSTKLTEPQKKVLDILQAYSKEMGYPPSIRDIQEEGGFSSTSVVNYYLDRLESLGFIERSRQVSRGIRLLADTIDDVLRIPVAGRIFASEPVPMPSTEHSFTDTDNMVNVARSLLPSRERTDQLFALEVRGDSMVDAMINDGDIVIMKPAHQALNGELVAIWLNNEETTLKYFYMEGNRVRLQPANPTMGPIYIDDPSTLQIQGKVVMVIRQVEKPM
ncbi:MAG: repressor LexA [Anaerolineales bacterium]|nr:repressor LexA [Anaerolineales bacterium]